MLKKLLDYLNFNPAYNYSPILTGIKSSTVPEIQTKPKNLGVTKAIANEYYSRTGSFDPVLYDKIMAAKLNY